MSPQDIPAFSASLKRLGRVMSRVVGDDLVEDYYSDLKEFPFDSVERAIEHVRRNAKYWPRPSAIREACLLVPGVASVTSVPNWVDPVGGRFFCGTCEDSGFVQGLTCAGNGACHIGHCGQTAGQTTEHSYTRRCGCVATNPVMMADRDKARQRNAPQHQGRE